MRIYDRENSDYVVVTEVEDRIVRWASATPIVRRYRAAGPTYLEVLEFEVFASLKDRREVFRGLQMSPLSRRYAPRIINAESQLVRARGSAVGGAAAAQPAAGGAGGASWPAGATASTCSRPKTSSATTTDRAIAPG